MSAVSRSPAGLARFHAIISAAIWVSSASAAAMAAAMSGSLTGSSERTTVPLSCLIRSWSAGGVPSISAITANGSGKASASTRSTRPWRSAASSISSTSPVMRGRSASTARGVNAFDTSRRSRVWSGGSRSSMEMPRGRAASSPYICSRSSMSWRSVMLRSSTDMPARSSPDTSSYRVSRKNPSGCRPAGAPLRSAAYCG